MQVTHPHVHVCVSGVYNKVCAKYVGSTRTRGHICSMWVCPYSGCPAPPPLDQGVQPLPLLRVSSPAPSLLRYPATPPPYSGCPATRGVMNSPTRSAARLTRVSCMMREGSNLCVMHTYPYTCSSTHTHTYTCITQVHMYNTHTQKFYNTHTHV